MKKHITIEKIAELAGVNRSTVSRALNPRTAGMISQSVRERIIAICDNHLYRPRNSAKAFASGRSSSISLILGDMPRDFLSPVFAEFITGLSIGVQALGYTLNVIHLDFIHGNDEPRLREILLSEQSDGYVMGAAIISEETSHVIQSLHPPVVALEAEAAQFSNIPAVIVDDRPAFCDLLKKLPSSLAGRCLFLGANNDATQRKMNILRNCLQSLGLPEDFFRFETFNVIERGVHIGRYTGQHYAENHLDFLRQFKFIWCAADLNALGLADVFTRFGITPGKDIYLAGIDNLEAIFNSPSPFLATIDPRPRECGQKTAEYIIRGVEDRTALQSNLLLQSSFVQRQSFPCFC